MLEDGVEDPNFIDAGLSASISDSSSSSQCEESKMHLPDEGLVEHKEAEAGIADQSSCPAIIGSMESLVDLVDIVSCSHSPFPEIVLEEIVAVGELAWVSFSFRLAWLIGKVKLPVHGH